MAINYNDSRFQAVEQEKQQALNNVNNTYGTMINQSDQFYTNQQNLVKDYENTQKELQQQQSDFTIEQINQQKDQAKQDYTKEQKASYVDYEKQSNQYGANAEAMASRGLTGTGYAESSQVSMYNTYQNRYATARETYNRAVLNYDNSIKEAQLANSSALAEISFNSMQKQLELALQGFQYKNTLVQTQLQLQNETEDRYYTRWKGVQDQINTENALEEQKRQYDQSMALQREQFNWQKQQAALENSIRAKATAGGGSSSKSSGSSSKKSDSISKGGKGSGSGGGGFRDGKDTSKAVKSLTSAIDNSTKGIFGGITKKNTAREMINMAYKQGTISEKDVKTLAKKYGLD
jgi:uncharacterized membrane protein YgcG